MRDEVVEGAAGRFDAPLQFEQCGQLIANRVVGGWETFDFIETPTAASASAPKPTASTSTPPVAVRRR